MRERGCWVNEGGGGNLCMLYRCIYGTLVSTAKTQRGHGIFGIRSVRDGFPFFFSQ